MATFNLVRNSRVFFTTNLGAVNSQPNCVLATGYLAANTQELQVLDGFSFSQASNADTVNVSEAGNTPVRGQRSFNTSLNNVEFSFSTYVRPRYSAPNVKSEESHLWNALLSTAAIGAAANFTATGITAASTTVDAAGVLSVAGTAMTLTGLNVGDVYVIKGVVGVGAADFNTAVKILSVTGTTAFTAQYLVKPSVAVITASWTAAVTLNKTAWNEFPAIGADTTSPQYSGTGAAYSAITSGVSNKNQLLPFGMVIKVDGITYLLDNCAMDQAVIDFGLDGIATIAWTGKGTAIRQTATVVTIDDTAPLLPVLSGGLTGTVTGKATTANYITNKLSTVSLIKNIGGTGAGNTTYTLALTGGSVTISNGITYVTPANLGIVNVPIGYYTGTRAISGSMTAYLRTGNAVGAGATGNSTGTLLSDLLAASATAAGVEPKFRVEIDIGGSASGTRVEIEMPGTTLQIPTIETQAVMSTTINFTAQGSDAVQGATANYDLENTNEVEIRYLSL